MLNKVFRLVSQKQQCVLCSSFAHMENRITVKRVLVHIKNNDASGSANADAL